MSKYTLQKIIKLFNADINRNTLLKAEESGRIPEAGRETTGAVKRRSWDVSDLPIIGEKYGFLGKLNDPVCATIFVTKGGVLKTTLTLNIARLAALHNIKTCIIGLDMQADITHAFGVGNDDEDAESLEEALEALETYPTLLDFERGTATLNDCLIKTDIPTLSIIPESSELVALEAKIQNMTRRDDWLKDNVVNKLKEDFDLILIDSPPNWNQLVSNALISSDVLISPLECKINHFRNVDHFQKFISGFKARAKVDFEQIYVPTKFVSTRKLSSEIRKWYIANIKNCITTSIRESILGEEAVASCVSLPEHAPTKIPSDEMREVVSEIWQSLVSASKKQSKSATDTKTSMKNKSVTPEPTISI